MNFVQGSEEWRQARVGKVTASRICDVMAKIKSGESASRRDYKAQLVAERLTGIPADDAYISSAMVWGTANEPFARAAYEMRTGVMVDQIAIVDHPTIPHCAASPDGIIEPDGLVEIKAPKTATHLQYILADVVPADYQPQMLWQMECAERDWCDFVSYDPRMPEHLQLFVKRMARDDKKLELIRTEVEKFLAEVDDILERLPKAPDPLTITDADILTV